MEYKFLSTEVDIENINLPESEKINPFLLKNNYADIIKAVDFLATDGKLLYVHGFLGTGKRQFVNYICDFLNKDVIKLEYYCKESTVCDDILLSFIDAIEKNAISKAINFSTKIIALNVKLAQYISSIKKPFVIVLHSYDDILDDNKSLINDYLSKIVKDNNNVKIIASTRALVQNIIGDLKIDRKIFLKAFTKEVFKSFLDSNQVNCGETTLEDFYKYTRGYYYYTALSCKIIQAMKISLNEFLEKYTQSGMNFDSFLGLTYVNLIPNTIRNFFWFLRTVRHGLTINALAVFELYDEFSVEYLKSNLMIFEDNETIYVQDYFLQNIDISIPVKTEIKLHKYIISIYEKQLKEPLQSREILISRQALRAEIEYHNKKIEELEKSKAEETSKDLVQNSIKEDKKNEHIVQEKKDDNLGAIFKEARKFEEEKKYTEAIEKYLNALDLENIGLQSVVEIRLSLARLYKEIGDYTKAQHYYELVEVYYKQNNEVINLNYLYYELTELYYLMYKNERAVETIKKVIYSVDTPQSLMVKSCTLLGNIYSVKNMPEQAYSYYEKALASLDENTPEQILAELYFKYALANDDKGDGKNAFDYYSKCIMINHNNPYKALAYSNMGSCYFENDNLSDAKDCFLKSYEIDKNNNNYEGIYYAASYLAKISILEKDNNALNYLIEAQQCAEFINEDFYILESTIALGDFYYNNISLNKKALNEYFKARKIALTLGSSVDISKINQRINDMKLRMEPTVFEEIKNKYE